MLIFQSMGVVLQPYELTSFLLVALIHFLMGAPEWVPQTEVHGGIRECLNTKLLNLRGHASMFADHARSR